MHKGLLVFLLSSFCQLAWGGTISSPKLSEVISRSYLLSASALVYFNPQERAPNPRSLTAVFYNLNTIYTYMGAQEQPAALAQPLAAIKSILDRLEALPPSQRESYPELVLQLLSEQQKLSQGAEELYVEQHDPSDSVGLAFNRQSNDLAKLLLDYQLRHYPEMSSSALVLSPAELQALVDTIEQRFSRLINEHAEHAEALSKINAQYRFVRGQVLQRKEHLHTGVEFYLSRAVLDLYDLAGSLAVSPH